MKNPNRLITTGLGDAPRYAPGVSERSFLIARAAYNAVMHPRNPDSVAALGDLTSLSRLKEIRAVMLENESGRQILRDRPRVNSRTIDVVALASFPKNSFGFSYYSFLKNNKITPDNRLPVRYIENEELAYILQRYREIHDFVHTITGLSTTFVDEIALKFIEMFATKLPVATLSSYFGILSIPNAQKLRFIRDFLPWALSHPEPKTHLLNVYYEKEFLTPITSLRNAIGIRAYSPPHA